MRQTAFLLFLSGPALLAGCAGNRAPVASAGPDQVVSSGAHVTLDGSASRDPDGKPITFAWKQTLGPSVALSSTSTPLVTLTAPASGTTLGFRLVVSDGRRKAAAKVNVSVHPLDKSASVVEVHQQPVGGDPAVSGALDHGFALARHPKTPPQPPDADEDEGAFQDFDKVHFAPPLAVQLAPGATREVELQVAGASVLLGDVRWEGTAAALETALSLDGSRVATGGNHALGAKRGGATLSARTPAAGAHATLSVTNTSGVGVSVKVTLGALPQ